MNTGLSTTWAPPNHEAMACYIVGGGSKMPVYGGRVGTLKTIIKMIYVAELVSMSLT